VANVSTILKEALDTALGGFIEQVTVRMVPEVVYTAEIQLNKVACLRVLRPTPLLYKPDDPGDITADQSAGSVR
jgi:hypothetical protein